MKSKKILIIVMSIIMLLSSLITSYAVVSDNYDYLHMTPDDLGSIRAVGNGAVAYNNQIIKYYIHISNAEQLDIIYMRLLTNGDDLYNYALQVTYNDGYYTISPHDINIDTCFFALPYLKLTSIDDIYIPIYCYNCSPYVIYDHSIRVYDSTTIDESVLRAEYYQLGYNTGYENGYSDGLIDAADYQSDLNIVQHIEQLLGTFIGEEYATYITPIALVLTILLIYFLFIRWLLSMIKAKGVLKVCDIIVLVACISILVVLYFPMIDITTTQHQIIENVYSVTSDITP